MLCPGKVVAAAAAGTQPHACSVLWPDELLEPAWPSIERLQGDAKDPRGQDQDRRSGSTSVLQCFFKKNAHFKNFFRSINLLYSTNGLKELGVA